jgi:glucose/mannose-6-phosphate isomerase
MSTIDYRRKQEQFDTTGQYANILGFPEQAVEGLRAAEAADLHACRTWLIRTVIVSGMGGSAIGGDILRSLALRALHVPYFVNRTYHLPGFIHDSTLLIAMSYSGNTEETLSAYNEARDHGAAIIAITTGGELAARAEADAVPIVRLPAGLAPRFALGYLFFALLGTMRVLGLLDIDDEDIAETIDMLRRKGEELGRMDDPANQAIAIAERLHGKLPVLYSGPELLEAAAIRWRCQIEENAKTLAYSNVIPELNHNEIVGWERNPDLLGRIAVLLLRDPGDAPEIARRFDVTTDLIRAVAGDIIEVRPTSTAPLARILELICIGDWVSFYLALGTDTDPFPIEKINALKAALAQIPPTPHVH